MQFTTAQSLTIAIDSEVLPGGEAGGVEQVLIGLVHALGRLNDGPEQYIIIGPNQQPNWLAPYLGPNQRIVAGPPIPVRFRRTKRVLGPLAPTARQLWRAGRRLMDRLPANTGPTVPVSKGFYETLGADLIHFPHQRFVHCRLPSVYNPHDLQHLHYPEFFLPEAVEWREAVYPAGCRLATTVVVASQWVKNDVVKRYSISPDRVEVIPWAPGTPLYDDVSEESVQHVAKEYDLQQPFALYPAATWQHKNHIGLLGAIAFLRDQADVRIQLVCTGHQNTFWPRIRARLHALALEPQVRFLGVVPGSSLRALYRLAQFVVLPTLFEGWGFPLFEAFAEGTPVACSAVTALPEHAGDAALLFDPTSTESIAQAIRRLATDEDLRTALICKGRERIRLFSWERTAKTYRALYRHVACRQLSAEDLQLLSDGA